MRFAGLFDCKTLEAHGVAILSYNEFSSNVDNVELTLNASSTMKDATYDNFIVERLPLLGPLNYAPLPTDKNEQIVGYIPITKLAIVNDHNPPEGNIYMLRRVYYNCLYIFDIIR